eukprot:CAMPEP_0113967342 /NCGR_PEP_ID=MMETSP0011_2-20120614/8871_1 /TAXON_ID=101924 /ORGANISM="Rhodosorus marinus" /LENGTH=45 /DNA_ID=CAMNT_0000980203 /DNA_START=397 /DNA_END=534 /DNA_ORIENTATION=- /assembly_acc=CAM_ASM_000156
MGCPKSEDGKGGSVQGTEKVARIGQKVREYCASDGENAGENQAVS